MMKMPFILGAGMLLLAGAAAGAEVYKWKDAKGVIQFSDQPPPAATGVEVKSYAGGTAGSLPFELAEAVRNAPVTLYTSAACAWCDKGRAMLKARGIPYTEKTVGSNEADHTAFREATGTDRLPVLMVGRTPLIGYHEGNWNAALNATAYPATSLLPANYEPPLPSPAGAVPPAPAATPAATPAAGEPARAEKLPSTRSASGFQF